MILFLLAAIPGWGQADNWMSDAGVLAADQPVVKQRLESLIKRSQQDGSLSHQNLRKMFRRVQRSVLKTYVPYSDFTSIFTEGKFDCLTATMLYAHLLESLSYRFDLIETNYHIYILVQTPDGEVMLETTDPIGGFITDAETIALRAGSYRRDEPRVMKSATAYRFQCSLLQRVSTDQLGGLLQFNRAVKAYNQGEWISCASHLAKAQQKYDNPRNRELCDVLVRTLIERKDISAGVRNECLARIQELLVSGPVVSSLN